MMAQFITQVFFNLRLYYDKQVMEVLTKHLDNLCIVMVLIYYCIQGYLCPVKFSPFLTCKLFRPVFNSPIVFKDR